MSAQPTLAERIASNPVRVARDIRYNGLPADLITRLQVIVAVVDSIDTRDLYFDMMYNPDRNRVVQDLIIEEQLPQVYTYLDHADNTLRRAALEVLITKPNTEHMPRVRELIYDPDLRIQECAVMALASHTLQTRGFRHEEQAFETTTLIDLMAPEGAHLTPRTPAKPILLTIDKRPPWRFESRYFLNLYQTSEDDPTWQFMIVENFMSGYLLMRAWEIHTIWLGFYPLHDQHERYRAPIATLQAIQPRTEFCTYVVSEIDTFLKNLNDHEKMEPEDSGG
ncbi:MAG: HEAT repeat domain-containing protein [Anaerolineae bacterium]|nr:HEAT repeat domain-containing protein [Anaerolineae bacterium]